MQSTLSILVDQLLRWDMQLAIVLSFSLATLWFIPRNQAALKHWILLVLVAATLSMPAFSLLLPPLALLRARPADVDVSIADVSIVELIDQDVVSFELGSRELNEPLRPIPVNTTRDRSKHVADTKSSLLAIPKNDELAKPKNGLAGPLEQPVIGSRQTPGVSWRVALLCIWASGTALLLMRLALAWATLRRRWRDSLPATSSAEEACGGACQQLGVGRKVTVRLSDSCSSPMTWGTCRPKIILPVESGGWSARRMRTILLHEVAHVKRCDSSWEYLIHLMCITHWFQPLAWAAAWQGRIQRERACDNAVLRQGVLASEYAECILEFAAGPRLPGGAIAMANVGGLRNRLKLILQDSSRPSLTVSQACLSGATAIGICLFAASLRLYASPVLVPPSDVDSTTQTDSARANMEQSPVQFGSTKLLVEGGVQGAKYSPDGTTLATISHRGNLELWDIATGERELKIVGHARGLAFSPAGNRIATRGAANSPIRIWDSTTGRLVSSLAVEVPTSAETGNLETIDLKFVDDATLVTVHPQLVRRWNLITGKEDLSQRRLLRLGRQISVMGRVSPFVSDDGRLLVERSNERLYIDKLNSRSTAPAIEYTAIAASTARCEFCNLGGMIAFFDLSFLPFHSAQSRPIVAFDTLTNEPVLIPDTEGKITTATADPFRPRIFAITGEDYKNRQLQILDLEAGRVVSKFPWTARNSIQAVHPDGEQIAVSAAFGVFLMDLATGELFPSPLDSSCGPVVDITYSADGKLIATAHGTSRVTIWESGTGRRVRRLDFFQEDYGEATRVAFTSDETALIVAGRSRELVEPRVPEPRGRPVYRRCVAMQRYELADHRFTTNTRPHGEAQLMDFAEKTLNVHKDKGNGNYPNRYQVTLVENGLLEWDGFVSRSESVIDSYTNDAGKSIWLLSPGGRINCWDTATGEKLEERDLPIGLGSASTCDIQAGCVVCSPTGFDVLILDIHDGTEKGAFQSSRTGDPIRLIRLSSSANQVGLVTDSGWLAIHDASTGQLLSERRLSSAARALKFSPSGNRILVGLADGTAVQWPTIAK